MNRITNRYQSLPVMDIAWAEAQGLSDAETVLLSAQLADKVNLLALYVFRTSLISYFYRRTSASRPLRSYGRPISSRLGAHTERPWSGVPSRGSSLTPFAYIQDPSKGNRRAGERGLEGVKRDVRRRRDGNADLAE